MKRNRKKNDQEINFFEEETHNNNRNILSILEGCRACGGPYPSCMSSCPMFDD